MKTKFFSMLLLLIATRAAINAQVPAHATIDSLKVRYRPVQAVAGTLPGRFSVIPEATVKLKATGSVSKIYFKLYKTNDSLVYQVQYPLNSPAITNAQGKKMFERSGNTLFISPGMAVPLKHYKYKLCTEDSLQVLSTDLIIAQ